MCVLRVTRVRAACDTCACCRRAFLSARRVVLRIGNDYLGAEVFDVSDDEDDHSVTGGSGGAAAGAGGGAGFMWAARSSEGGAGGSSSVGTAAGGALQQQPSAEALQPQAPLSNLFRRYSRVLKFALQVSCGLSMLVVMCCCVQRGCHMKQHVCYTRGECICQAAVQAGFEQRA